MYNISSISTELKAAIENKINNKTKPLGSLGQLEALAKQIALIQESLSPCLNKPEFIVFAGDNGIAEEGVSPFPQEVTSQMVLNFMAGGAAINSFCAQHGINLTVVDAGVATELPEFDALHNCKIALGTNNFLQEKAMSKEQLQQAFASAATIVAQKAETGCNVIGFGEMGIGNTTCAAAIMSCLLELPASECVGRGTGLDDAGVLHKQHVIEQAQEKYQLSSHDALSVLETFGGFEIAMMTGAMLSAAEQKMVILLDGFIASAAALLAVKLEPLARSYMVFCHKSDEQAHAKLLSALQAQPLLDLSLRLGEGSGAALAYPLLQSAVGFFNDMASFESAGVANQ